MTSLAVPTSESLLWHHLAHAGFKPSQRIEVLRAAKAHHGEVADLSGWVQAGFPGVAPAIQTTLEQALEASVIEGFLLQDLAFQGMKVLTGRDQDYPKRFKQTLKDKTPIVLYVSGNAVALNARRTIAIVGSRDAGEAALEVVTRAAQYFAAEQYVLVSGNARGIDQQAEEAALAAGGQVVSVLPQGLLDKSTSALIRQRNRALLDGQIVLLSELHPKSRWQGRFAMMRNRLIMALADVVLVAQTGSKSSVVGGKKMSSGTWAGAEDAQKLGKRIFVLDLPIEGNQALAQHIAQPLAITADNSMFHVIEDSLLTPTPTTSAKLPTERQPNLFGSG